MAYLGIYLHWSSTIFQSIIKDAPLEGKLAIHSLPHTSLVKTLPGFESTLQPGHNICIARSPAFSIHSQQRAIAFSFLTCHYQSPLFLSSFWFPDCNSPLNFLLAHKNSTQISRFSSYPASSMWSLIIWLPTSSSSPGFPGSWESKEYTGNAGDLGCEDPLEKGMATYSSILAWRIPWTEEPGRFSPWSCKESDMTEWLSLSLSSSPNSFRICYLKNLVFHFGS